MRRRALVGSVLAAVLAALPACAALPPGGAAPVPPGPTLVAASGTDGVTRVRLDHRAGAAVATPVVVVPRGGTVELVVGSDTAERVLVSGLDQARYVTAGGTVTLRFVAAAPGPLAVRLGSGAELAQLDVR